MTAVAQERAMAGAAAAGLSNRQKQLLCMKALKAWEAQGRPMYADPDMPAELRMGKSLAFETWRQLEQERVTGERSLRRSGQAAYCALMAHFSKLSGDEGGAAWWGRRAGEDDARRARAALRREMNGPRAYVILGRPSAYVAALCRDKFGVRTWEQLAPEQLWQLVFTLRRAITAKERRKAAEAAQLRLEL